MEMTKEQMFNAKYGDKIKANGFEGRFYGIYDITGMIEVRLPGGMACLSIDEVELMPTNEQEWLAASTPKPSTQR